MPREVPPPLNPIEPTLTARTRLPLGGRVPSFLGSVLVTVEMLSEFSRSGVTAGHQPKPGRLGGSAAGRIRSDTACSVAPRRLRSDCRSVRPCVRTSDNCDKKHDPLHLPGYVHRRVPHRGLRRGGRRQFKFVPHFFVPTFPAAFPWLSTRVLAMQLEIHSTGRSAERGGRRRSGGGVVREGFGHSMPVKGPVRRRSGGVRLAFRP